MARDVSARPSRAPSPEKGTPRSPGGRPQSWPAARDVLPFLLAAATLFPLELMMLSSSGLRVAWVVLVLLATTGVMVGLIVALQQRIVAALALDGMKAAFVRSLGTLIVTVPAAKTMFEGSFAATLPGATWGHVWVPLVGLAASIFVLRLATPWANTPQRQRMLGTCLALVACMVELTNRTVKRDELVDIHTAALIATVACAGLAARLLLFANPTVGLAHSTTSARRTTQGAILATFAGFGLALVLGLRDSASRWAVTASGTHTRLLVRVVRSLTDIDGDGHSAALGGGDCDDANPAIHPGAREIVGNDADEDCDGIALADDDLALSTTADHTTDLIAWRQSPRVASFLAETADMNVVLIVVDALRADLLVDDPKNRSEFPNSFALLDESRVFSRAFAPAAGTDLSLSGLLTGRVDPFGEVDLTLAEGLKAAGLRTFAVIPSEVLRYVGRTLLLRGLDEHARLVNDMYEQDVGTYTTSERTTDLALRFLDDLGQSSAPSRFFLWAHYFDVHEHHEISPRDRRLAAYLDDRKSDRTARYRALMKVVDDEIGRLTSSLRERGEWERTIVVFVSDHGESLGEHERLPENHGLYLYNALVHVPLAVRIPGTTPGIVETPVGLLDVFPTVLELVGVSGFTVVDGQSLVPLLGPEGAPRPADGRPLPLHESDQVGVIVWPHKLMIRPADNLIELYDLAADFGEQSDLSAHQPRLVARLRAVYDRFPTVDLDRTRRGRSKRERLAKTALERTREHTDADR